MATNEDRRAAAAQVRAALHNLAEAIEAAKTLDIMVMINSNNIVGSLIMTPMTDDPV